MVRLLCNDTTGGRKVLKAHMYLDTIRNTTFMDQSLAYMTHMLEQMHNGKAAQTASSHFMKYLDRALIEEI